MCALSDDRDDDPRLYSATHCIYSVQLFILFLLGITLALHAYCRINRLKCKKTLQVEVTPEKLWAGAFPSLLFWNYSSKQHEHPKDFLDKLQFNTKSFQTLVCKFPQKFAPCISCCSWPLGHLPANQASCLEVKNMLSLMKVNTNYPAALPFVLDCILPDRKLSG